MTVCPIQAKYVDAPRLPPHVVSVSVNECKGGEIEAWYPFIAGMAWRHQGFIFKGYSESSQCAYWLATSHPQSMTLTHLEGNWYWYHFGGLGLIAWAKSTVPYSFSITADFSSRCYGGDSPKRLSGTPLDRSAAGSLICAPSRQPPSGTKMPVFVVRRATPF